MFCSCCRDVQSGGSTSELRLGEDKGYEPQTGHAEGSGGKNVREPSTATADGSAHQVAETEQAGTRKTVSESPFVNASAKTPAANTGSKEPSRPAIKGGVFKPPPKPEPAPIVVPLTLQQSDKARRTSAPIAGSLAAGAYLMFDKESDTLYCQWSAAPQPAALAWLMPVVQVPGHKFNVNKGKQVLAKECKIGWTDAVLCAEMLLFGDCSCCLLTSKQTGVRMLTTYVKEAGNLFKQNAERLQTGRLSAVADTGGNKFFLKSCGRQGTPWQNPEKYLQGWISFVKITREYPAKLMLLDNFETSGAPDVRIFLLETPPDQAGISFAREVNEYNKLYDMVKNIKAVAAVPPSSNLLSPDEAIDSKTFLQRGTGVGAAVALTG